MAETVSPRAYGVAEINFYLKNYLAEDSFLSSIAVRGEVSGFRYHDSGHVYLTLGEGESHLKLVMFRRYAASQSWLPRNGERIVAIGAISLYERDGACQLYAEALFPDGAGAQADQLEQLRYQLEQEGLFAPERKRPLPRFAEDVGVITAANSAAWADMQRILRARWPQVKMTLYPTLVQGDQAPAAIASALVRADGGSHDVLICGRGGGAGEDLSAFNSEQVARAIAATHTPLIIAVGHESDFSLADLAADVRAATPTHAATLAVADAAETLRTLQTLTRRLHEQTASRLVLPQQRLDAAELRLRRAVADALARKAERLSADTQRLHLLSPTSVLARGYALVTDAEDKTLYRAADTRPGNEIFVRLAEGRLRAVVETMEEGDNNG